ncbi:hypothetical protein PCC8801_0342 [Rippkaea orientalis PCC 8801]|uniref:Uncharacterized protein n=1 Tax=Rippkaea orientalis (strain PCC 8801 / RF-1) TaxID=41431 RepID=B7K3C0_RIPO1|nr:hypothetical protein PCC8801_0342 [Rippkaea orientalis PCC 8801]
MIKGCRDLDVGENLTKAKRAKPVDANNKLKTDTQNSHL